MASYFVFFLVCISYIYPIFSCDVLYVGSSIVDYTVFASDEWLKNTGVEKGGVKEVSSAYFDQTLARISSNCIRKSGGSAGIAAKGMSHLGLEVSFLSRYGNDDEGRFFRSVLENRGIHLYGRIRPGNTARVLCFISPDGQRTFFFASGDHGVLSCDDVDESVIAQAKMIHIEGYTIRDPRFLETILKIAKKHRVKVSFDLGSFVLVREQRQFIQNVVFPYIDILIGNADEMKALFENEAQIDSTLVRLPFLSVMLQGPHGCKVYWGGKVSHYTTQEVKPLDTTGAGDVFTSGFLFGLSKGWPLSQCAALANHLGGTVITHIGGEIPDECWKQIVDRIQ